MKPNYKFLVGKALYQNMIARPRFGGILSPGPAVAPAWLLLVVFGVSICNAKPSSSTCTGHPLLLRKYVSPPASTSLHVAPKKDTRQHWLIEHTFNATCGSCNASCVLHMELEYVSYARRQPSVASPHKTCTAVTVPCMRVVVTRNLWEWGAC